VFAKGGSWGCMMSVSLPFHLKNILYVPSILECLCRRDSVATLQDLIPVSCKRFHSPLKWLTTHIHVMPRLRMNGVLPPFCFIWLSGVDRDNCAWICLHLQVECVKLGLLAGTSRKRWTQTQLRQNVYLCLCT
jgi:hypothetical protein